MPPLALRAAATAALVPTQLRAVGDEAPWEDAPVRPSEFVVIIGDVLERMTNGVLRATPHRVLPSLAQV